MVDTSLLKKSQAILADNRRIELTEPQLKVQLIAANYTLLLWGRGTGKTTKGGAPYLVRVASAMPGHLGCILGLSYNQIETNVLPKLLLGINQLGYIEGKDYCFGRPPKHWPSCLYPLKNYDRTLTWRNGSAFQQISIHEPGSANAFDFQSLMADEAKFLSQKQVEGEILPTLRGFDNLFGHLPEYLSQFWMTDKYMDYLLLKWLLDKRQLVDHEAVQLVYDLQLYRIELSNAMPQVSKRDRNKCKQTLLEIDQRLVELRKDLVFVSEASAETNRGNLGEKWWSEQRKKGAYEFRVATGNEDPTQSTNGFYPALAAKHTYGEIYLNCDYNYSLPLIIALDYQASIAPLITCQLSQLSWEKRPTCNFINEFYSKHPEGLEETVTKFCNHYYHHPHKQVIYVFDNTAIGRRVSAKRVKDIVIAVLRQHHWNVTEVYIPQLMDHPDRYQKIKSRLEENSLESIPYRFNIKRMIKTLISMRGAGTKVSNGKTRKNKDFENTLKYPDIDQSETTHFSECFDQLDHAINEVGQVTGISGIAGMGTGFR